MKLRAKIEAEIQQHGPMRFGRYMEMCLYDPELGYYTRNAEQFGKAGDFYTSCDVHAVFGRLLARQFEEMWRTLGAPARIEVVELGPGRGLFAQDVLDWSEKKFPEFFAAVHYSLVESSCSLRARLQSTLSRHFGAGKASLAEISPKHNSPRIVFANEFFDALPVEVVSGQGELRMDVRGGRFVETWGPSSAEELQFLDRWGVHPEGDDRVEVTLAAQAHMLQIARAIERGFLVAIDYGYTREEQLAGRHRGTVTGFRHHALANPYAAPGEQDITAHVNFTALAAAAEQNGMQAQPLVTQSQFLLGIGEPTQFGDAFEECRLPQERAKVALQLKHLVTPAGMGESFQVLVASKGVGAEQVRQLSGLGFGKTAAVISVAPR